jgi:hypothetical protein
MVMEFLADDPHGNDGVLEMFAYFDVLECFEDCEETELGTLGDAFDLVVVDDLLAVEEVGAGFAGQDQVHKLLCAVAVVTDQRIILYVHFLLDLLRALCQHRGVQKSSHSEVFIPNELLPTGPYACEG